MCFSCEHEARRVYEERIEHPAELVRGVSRGDFLRLGGAAFAGAALLGFASEEAAAQSKAPDYPKAVWHPAHETNYYDAARERSHDINAVMVHASEDSYKNTWRYFQTPRLNVSTHYVVGMAGQVVQLVRHADIGFHSGSRYYDNHSIGIEHACYSEDASSWTDELYRASARLTAYICRRHNVPVDERHILRHRTVSQNGRTCPGSVFDLDRYLSLVKEFK
jgi:N-acetyl-anhydromuramyl-L-alanine amidase AmpD